MTLLTMTPEQARPIEPLGALYLFFSFEVLGNIGGLGDLSLVSSPRATLLSGQFFFFR